MLEFSSDHGAIVLQTVCMDFLLINICQNYYYLQICTMEATDNLTCHICDVTVKNDVNMIEHMVTKHSNGTTSDTPGSGKSKKSKILLKTPWHKDNIELCCQFFSNTVQHHFHFYAQKLFSNFCHY